MRREEPLPGISLKAAPEHHDTLRTLGTRLQHDPIMFDRLKSALAPVDWEARFTDLVVEAVELRHKLEVRLPTWTDLVTSSARRSSARSPIAHPAAAIQVKTAGKRVGRRKPENERSPARQLADHYVLNTELKTAEMVHRIVRELKAERTDAASAVTKAMAEHRPNDVSRWSYRKRKFRTVPEHEKRRMQDLVARGLTLVEVARIVGCDRTTVYKYVRGKGRGDVLSPARAK